MMHLKMPITHRRDITARPTRECTAYRHSCNNRNNTWHFVQQLPQPPMEPALSASMYTSPMSMSEASCAGQRARLPLLRASVAEPLSASVPARGADVHMRLDPRLFRLGRPASSRLCARTRLPRDCQLSLALTLISGGRLLPQSKPALMLQQRQQQAQSRCCAHTGEVTSPFAEQAARRRESLSPAQALRPRPRPQRRGQCHHRTQPAVTAAAAAAISTSTQSQPTQAQPQQPSTHGHGMACTYTFAATVATAADTVRAVGICGCMFSSQRPFTMFLVLKCAGDNSCSLSCCKLHSFRLRFCVSLILL